MTANTEIDGEATEAILISKSETIVLQSAHPISGVQYTYFTELKTLSKRMPKTVLLFSFFFMFLL